MGAPYKEQTLRTTSLKNKLTIDPMQPRLIRYLYGAKTTLRVVACKHGHPPRRTVLNGLTNLLSRYILTGNSDPELDLLKEPVSGEETASASNHALRTAPVFTGDAFDEMTHAVFPQRGLYGRILSQHTISTSRPDDVVSPKLHLNTNTPFSALICGVQVCSRLASVLYQTSNVVLRIGFR